MNIPHLVVELNNKAIQCLANGDCDGSVAAISNALSSLQLCQSMAASPSSSRMNLKLNLAVKFMDAMKNNSDHNINTQMASLELNTTGSLAECSGSFSIFSHILTIPNAYELESDVTKNFERIQAMLLYNLGLTVHLQAMRSGRSEELKGALQLYEMAFSVVENSWQLMCLDDLMLLMMALLNNLGHIHATLYNMPQTQCCVDWLKGLAGHPAFLNIMQREQYSGFSMNLLVVLKQYSSQVCSPAA